MKNFKSIIATKFEHGFIFTTTKRNEWAKIRFLIQETNMAHDELL